MKKSIFLKKTFIQHTWFRGYKGPPKTKHKDILLEVESRDEIIAIASILSLGSHSLICELGCQPILRIGNKNFLPKNSY